MGCASTVQEIAWKEQAKQTRALFSQNRLIEALQSAQSVLNKVSLEYGIEHAITLRATHELAIIYAELGYDEQAETLWLHVLDVARHVPGFPVYDSILVASNLAYLYQQQERSDESEQLYLFAIALLEEEKDLTLNEEKELAGHLLHYLDLLKQTGRSDQRKAMRMQIELLIQRARKQTGRRVEIEGYEQDELELAR